MFTLKVWRDPYDIGVTFTRARNIELKEGLTVLVGCNGSGKSTLLLNIENQCKKEHIHLYSYNNLHDGGHNALSSYLLTDNINMFAGNAFASEGEAISSNLGFQATKFRKFLAEGEEIDPFVKLMMDKKDVEDEEKELAKSKVRVMLFDAIDSGLSIDQVREIKHLFSLMIEDAKNLGVELYIVASCNEFELARDEQCINISSGKYTNIHTYKDFEKVVLKTRDIKDKRTYKDYDTE